MRRILRDRGSLLVKKERDASCSHACSCRECPSSYFLREHCRSEIYLNAIPLVNREEKYRALWIGRFRGLDRFSIELIKIYSYMYKSTLVDINNPPFRSDLRRIIYPL
jgi:hypothetical protein